MSEAPTVGRRRALVFGVVLVLFAGTLTWLALRAIPVAWHARACRAAMVEERWDDALAAYAASVAARGGDDVVLLEELAAGVVIAADAEGYEVRRIAMGGAVELGLDPMRRELRDGLVADPDPELDDSLTFPSPGTSIWYDGAWSRHDGAGTLGGTLAVWMLEELVVVLARSDPVVDAWLRERADDEGRDPDARAEASAFLARAGDEEHAARLRDSLAADLAWLAAPGHDEHDDAWAHELAADEAAWGLRDERDASAARWARRILGGVGDTEGLVFEGEDDDRIVRAAIVLAGAADRPEDVTLLLAAFDETRAGARTVVTRAVARLAGRGPALRPAVVDALLARGVVERRGLEDVFLLSAAEVEAARGDAGPVVVEGELPDPAAWRLDYVIGLDEAGDGRALERLAHAAGGAPGWPRSAYRAATWTARARPDPRPESAAGAARGVVREAAELRPSLLVDWIDLLGRVGDRGDLRALVGLLERGLAAAAPEMSGGGGVLVFEADIDEVQVAAAVAILRILKAGGGS